MKTAKNGDIRTDFYVSGPGWVTAVVTELKTGRKAQATAGSQKAAHSAALHKLKTDRIKAARRD